MVSVNLASTAIWASTVVAVVFVLLIAVLMIVAMVKHEMDGALKMWSALGTLVGLLTGSVGTYFFTGTAAATAASATRLADQAVEESARLRGELVSAEETVQQQKARLSDVNQHLGRLALLSSQQRIETLDGFVKLSNTLGRTDDGFVTALMHAFPGKGGPTPNAPR